MDLTVFTGPLADLVFAAVAAAFAALLPIALKWFYGKTKLDNLVSDGIVRDYLNEVLDRAINFAKAKVAKQKITVDTDNVIAGIVYEYLKNSVPDALKHFNLTEEKVAQIVQARIAAALK